MRHFQDFSRLYAGNFRKWLNLHFYTKSDIIYGMKTIFAYFCLFMFMVCHLGAIGAMELEFSGGVNNMTAQTDQGEISVFDPNLFINGKISFRGDISKAWGIGVNMERDNLFSNTLDIRLNTRADYFGFEFGLFTGMTDAFDGVDMGILGKMEIFWPKVLFLSLYGSSTIGSNFAFTASHSRESLGAQLGFWLPYIIPTLSVNIKSINRTAENGDTIRDTLMRYQLSADVFDKTSPVSFRLDGGYQMYMRDFNENWYGLYSLFAGFDFQFNVSKSVRLIFGGEVPFMFEVYVPAASEEFWMFYKAYAGVLIRFF